MQRCQTDWTNWWNTFHVRITRTRHRNRAWARL